jgi:hypothetical protein
MSAPRAKLAGAVIVPSLKIKNGLPKGRLLRPVWPAGGQPLGDATDEAFPYMKKDPREG